MSIVIGADLVPTKSNVELFEKGDIDTLIGSELKDIILSLTVVHIKTLQKY